MNDFEARSRATTRPEQTAVERLAARPDRLALWAVALAVIVTVAAAVSAQASSGGVGAGGGGTGTGGSAGCAKEPFGNRALKLGDCGSDVKTLNWLLKAKEFDVSLDQEFGDPTDSSVRDFQEQKGLRSDGVVEDQTRQALRHTLGKSTATWYGPGFFGNRTACGTTLKRSTPGVAHRKLPCGTKVVVGYQGNWVRTRVIDRGPFANGADWDLTQKTARKLGFETTDRIRTAVIRKKKHGH